MLIRIITCLLLVGSTCALAQEPSTAVPTDNAASGEATVDAKSVMGRLDRVDAALADLKKLAKKINKNSARITKNEQGIQSLTEAQELTNQALGNHEERITKLEGTVEQLNDLLADLQVAQGQILTQSGGQYTLNLRGQMQNENFQREFADAIDQSIGSRTGQFVVRNKMATAQYIKLNRTEYRVEAGGILTVPVQPGTIATKLPGESIKTWLIGAPHYKQSIDIVPRQSNTVYYSTPVDQVYVNRPIYSPW